MQGSYPSHHLSGLSARRVEKLQRSFLWGYGIQKRKMHAEKWMEVCKSKDRGGLGIGRMVDKNKAMLAKWIWRFDREENSLWRRIICSKYRVNKTSLFWKWHDSKPASFFVKLVESLFKAGSWSAKAIEGGFVTVIGRWDRANFYTDIKMEGRPLNEPLPRCFALSTKNDGLVQEFGGWPDSNRW
ncbi:hypothetical protein Dsin_015703 [Dipteronia sinensis]|uniref:Uncharacterized protein n=1 Tax=Dipteronia sinensis TaxID=43782 RepID=A0AAE0E509_9ROSI|nr:hypothetical protein Dsin_015703 [Dipteronia sinensis]